MQWKDKDCPAEDEGGPGRLDVEAPGYSVLHNTGGGFSLAGLFRMPIVPIALLVVAAALIGWAVLRNGNGDASASGERFSRVEGQLTQMEERLNTMASKPAEPDRSGEIADLQRRIDGLSQRLDRIEAGVAQRIAAAERGAKTQASAAAPKAPAAAKTPAPAAKTPAAKAPEPKTKASFYEVKAGDTLFSIARRANLSVDKLRQINQLKADASIHPGDRLRISP